MRRGRLISRILIALLIPILLCGCSRIPKPFGSQKAATLRVVTSPSNAIVFLRARAERSNEHTLGEFWAVGTTPFDGRLEPGFWDMRVEAVGYEPVEILMRAVRGRGQVYDLQLVSLPYGTR